MEKVININVCDDVIDNPKFKISSEKIKKYRTKFNLTGEMWKGLVIKAIFSNRSKEEVKAQYLEADNSCIVPWEVLTGKGDVYVNLVGIEINEKDIIERMTSLRCHLFNIISVPIDGDNTLDPTPSEVEQLQKLLAAARDIAQSVRDDADAGKFDGYTPVKGKDYFTNGEIESFKNEVTPRRGVDYYTPSEIAEIKHEATPQRGTDYWTAEDVASINTESHTYIDNDMKGYTERASESARLSEQAFADFLRMLGKDVATLVGGKIPVSQIPAIATTEIYTVATEAERDKLSVQNGDICIVTYNDATKSKSFIYNNGWTYLASPTDYASKSGYSETCGTAENSNKINGHRLIQMSASEFEGAVKDNDTYYLVY